MQKIFSILFVALLCLTACASPTAVPTLTPPATSTSLPPTLQPTAKLEPTATVAPTETPTPEFDEKAEKAKLRKLIEEAPTNVKSLEELNSPEYLEWLRARDAQGLLPNVSDKAIFVKPGEIVLRLDKLGTDNIYINYGVTHAYSIDGASSWWNLEKTPFTLVDVGVVPDLKLAYRTFKWLNSDGTVAFQGFISYADHSEIDLTVGSTFMEVAGLYANFDFAIYPTIGYFDGINGCTKLLRSNGSRGNFNNYCKTYGENSQFISQTETILAWQNTGILKNKDRLTFTPVVGRKIKK